MSAIGSTIPDAFLHQIRDANSTLNARIAMAGPTHLPALGGIRILPYPSDADADADAARLADGMARKAAILDLPYSGGKTVIRGTPETVKSEAVWATLGSAINQLDGRYVGGEDVNMSVADIDALRRHTPYLAGTSNGCGNPAPFTARGVFNAMRAAVRHRFGAVSFSGLKVLIQGAGSVGQQLAGLVHAAGGKLAVCDIDPGRVGELVTRFDAEAVSPERLLDQHIDVFAPCALGAVIREDNLSRLDVGVICGAANNQLENSSLAERLHHMGIVYIPDYLANGGGLIAGAAEYEASRAGRRFEIKQVNARIDTLDSLCRGYLEQARDEDCSPAMVCEHIVGARMAAS